MSLMRSLLLAASQNRWLRDHATQYSFVRGTVSRFMPGETLDDALGAAEALRRKKIGTVFTHLGENIKDRAEAQQVTEHYLEVLKRIRENGLDAEISVKLTQLGLDLSPHLCFEHLNAIIDRAEKDSIVWVDMEASNYVDATLDLYRRALTAHPNVGICLQAYLYRTKDDLANLLPLRPSIRLVKGAYNEPPEIAFPHKHDVDESYFVLGRQMLRAKKEPSGKGPSPFILKDSSKSTAQRQPQQFLHFPCPVCVLKVPMLPSREAGRRCGAPRGRAARASVRRSR